jgi:hypothetical protein
MKKVFLGAIATIVLAELGFALLHQNLTVLIIF